MAHEIKRVDNDDGTHTVTVATSATDSRHIVMLNEHLDTDTWGQVLANAQDNHNRLRRLQEGFGA